MSILGLIMLFVLSAIAMYALIFGSGEGIKNYAVRNTVGIYIIIIALLAIIKSTNGIPESLYLGLTALVIMIFSLVLLRREVANKYSKVRMLYIAAIIISTFGAYMSYVD